MIHRDWLLPTPEDQTDLRCFWDAYKDALDEVRTEMISLVMEHPRLSKVTQMPQNPGDMERSEALQRGALEQGKWEAFLDDLHLRGVQYAQLGIRLDIWYELLRLTRVALLRRLAAFYANDNAKLVSSIAGMDRFIDLSMGAIAASYVTEKERIISDQAAAIKELATPILRLKDRFLVVPVVGVVDTHRARELTESLLHAVRRYRARAVVLDITGVPIVDSKVANHLVQTVEAVRLMGANVILSGISPDIARTLVAIGANMSTVLTVGEFDAAVELAEKMLHQLPKAAALTPADEAA